MYHISCPSGLTSINPQHPRLTIPRSVTAAPSSYTEETTGPKAYDIYIYIYICPASRPWMFRVSCSKDLPMAGFCNTSWHFDVKETHCPCQKVTIVPFPSLTMAQSKGRFESTICPGDLIQKYKQNFIKAFLTGLVTQNKWLQHGDRESRGSKFDSGQSRPRLSSGKVPSSASSSPVESTATRGSR